MNNYVCKSNSTLENLDDEMPKVSQVFCYDQGKRDKKDVTPINMEGNHIPNRGWVSYVTSCLIQLILKGLFREIKKMNPTIFIWVH